MGIQDPIWKERQTCVVVRNTDFEARCPLSSWWLRTGFAWLCWSCIFQHPLPWICVITVWSSLLARSYGHSHSLNLWHGTTARMTFPSAPVQFLPLVSSNAGSMTVQPGKCASLSGRSPSRWVVGKRRNPHFQLVSMSFIFIFLSGCWPCWLQAQPLWFSGP